MTITIGLTCYLCPDVLPTTAVGHDLHEFVYPCHGITVKLGDTVEFPEVGLHRGLVDSSIIPACNI